MNNRLYKGEACDTFSNGAARLANAAGGCVALYYTWMKKIFSID
jgi:hypothetical protein